MTTQFNVSAQKVTLFSGTYASLAAAQAAGSPLVATNYDVVYSSDGTSFFINASLVQTFNAIYPTEAAANAAASPYISTGYLVDIREVITDGFETTSDEMRILYSPSIYRTPEVTLDGGYFSPTFQAAVFIQDPAGVGITQVDFKLDTVLVNTELSAPWDYAGTDGFGNANRVTFSAGLHVVEAVVTATSGNFTLTANFEVE